MAFSQSNFIEREALPSDSEVIGYTWNKANKDGSRDRRFSNNYQIPIAKYAESRALSFFQALTDYQMAAVTLAERPGGSSATTMVAFSKSSPEMKMNEPRDERSHSVAAEAPSKGSLVFDWMALGLMMVAVVIGIVMLGNLTR